MSYLSKIRINPMREAARIMLGNPHRVHALIQQGIAIQPVTERTLWRWESTASRHQPHLLVLTESRPDWTHVAEHAGWPHADGEHFTIRDYEPLFTHLAIGREFAFKLTANPVQNTSNPVKPSRQQADRRSSDPKARGERLGHRTVAQQLAWLLRKQERCGFRIPTLTLATTTQAANDAADQPRLETPDAAEDFTVPDVRLTARDRLSFTKRPHDKGPSIVLSIATFEGRLTVTDPTALRTALLSGIGPAKSYGCGLLTLAPLPEAAHA